jgi:hypothetical protein
MKVSLRKILSFVVVLAIAAASASAAGITDKGLKLGFNLANLSTDEQGSNLSSRSGFAIGGFLTFQLTDMISIQPEVLFMQKGAKSNFSEGEMTAVYTYRLSYIDIPVLVKVLLPVQGAKLRPNLYAGPYFGIKAGSKLAYTIEGYGEKETGEENLTSIKSTDLGLVLGGGIDFPMGAGKILLDLRYSLGLTSISTDEDKTKNGVLSILLGYSF